MVRAILVGVAAVLFLAVPHAFSQQTDDVKALEDLLSPDELAMEFGPASRLDRNRDDPWPDDDEFAIKPNPARFERTEDLSQLPYDPAERIEELMPAHLEPLFDLILYVSKAPEGATAQQMFIYERDEARALHLTDRWLISTGREQSERYFTTTPPGFFMLDPHRFVSRAYSAQWNGSAMPYAMFFNYSYRDRMSGYAIHGILPRYHRYLGRRASGGCVRLSYDHAEELYERVQRDFAGRVPRFAFDYVTGTTFRDGTVERDANGQMRTEWGYRVLLIVDTFGG